MILQQLDQTIKQKTWESLPEIINQSLYNLNFAKINRDCPKRLALAKYITVSIKYKRRCKAYKDHGIEPNRVHISDGLSLWQLEENKNYWRVNYYGSECTCNIPEKCCRKSKSFN